MDQVVMGTDGQNTLRRLSRFAPSSGGLSAMLGLGGMASIPEIAIPATITAEIAKKLGESSTGASIEKLLNNIAPSRILDPGSNGMKPILDAILAARISSGDGKERKENALSKLLAEKMRQGQTQ